MSDPTQRALGRAAPTDPEARAAWLRGALRAGELIPRRVELLAALGDEGAALACPEVEALPPEPRERWIQLGAWDLDALTRLALAASAPLVARLAADTGGAAPLEEALSEAWSALEEPDLARRESARRSAELAREEGDLYAERLLDLQIEGEPCDWALVAWGALAPVRLVTELRREDLRPLVAEVFSELEAGYAELERELSDPVHWDPLLAELRAFCLRSD